MVVYMNIPTWLHNEVPQTIAAARIALLTAIGVMRRYPDHLPGKVVEGVYLFDHDRDDKVDWLRTIRHAAWSAAWAAIGGKEGPACDETCESCSDRDDACDTIVDDMLLDVLMEDAERQWARAYEKRVAEITSEVPTTKTEDGRVVTWQPILQPDRVFRLIPATIGGRVVAWWSYGKALIVVGGPREEVAVAPLDLTFPGFEEVEMPIPPWATTVDGWEQPRGRYVLKDDVGLLVKAWCSVVAP